jgi:hypothetical protein
MKSEGATKVTCKTARAKRIVLWIGGTLALLVGLAFGYYRFILDWEARPGCHKGFMFAFYTWMDDNGKDANTQTNDFPNINGIGAISLAAISNGMGSQMVWAHDYRYVPGLRQNDPGDLVLLYLNRPTRWTWHGAPGTIFRKRVWMVVPVDFTIGGRPRSRNEGEMSERLSPAEFRSRLSRTLDFIRTNERPNWRTIVAEHTKFLKDR